jgi:hypothetical protein
MKYMLTELEGKNKSINFAQSILRNYFLETDHGCYEAQPSKIQIDIQYELLPYINNEDNGCITLK